MKPRVLIVLPNLSPGGAERSILNLAGQLAGDFEIHLALIRTAGELLSAVPPEVRLHSLHGRAQFPFRFIALSWRLKPCIVLSTISDVSFVVLALKRFLPAAAPLVIRDAVMPLDGYRHRRLSPVWRWIFRWAYGNADAVVPLTERCRKGVIGELGVRRDKVFLIHNAVSDARLSTTKLPGTNGGDAVNIVSIGRLERQKAYDLLIRSLPRVLQEYPRIRLTIYGAGREQRHLQREIGRLNLGHVVTLAGYVTDPIPLLRQADLFVLCSRYEGMSNAMLEALCCGTPVLATDNPENSAEEFIIDGKNGFLARGGCSVEAIEAGLLRAMREFRFLDRDKIRRDALGRFSFEANVRGYRDLLKRISAGNHL